MYLATLDYRRAQRIVEQRGGHAPVKGAGQILKIPARLQ
jgi:hypothetical protein